MSLFCFERLKMNSELLNFCFERLNIWSKRLIFISIENIRNFEQTTQKFSFFPRLRQKVTSDLRNSHSDLYEGNIAQSYKSTKPISFRASDFSFGHCLPFQSFWRKEERRSCFEMCLSYFGMKPNVLHLVNI